MAVLTLVRVFFSFPSPSIAIGHRPNVAAPSLPTVLTLNDDKKSDGPDPRTLFTIYSCQRRICVLHSEHVVTCEETVFFPTSPASEVGKEPCSKAFVCTLTKIYAFTLSTRHRFHCKRTVVLLHHLTFNRAFRMFCRSFIV